MGFREAGVVMRYPWLLLNVDPEYCIGLDLLGVDSGEYSTKLGSHNRLRKP